MVTYIFFFEIHIGGQSEFLFDQERINTTLDHVESRFDPRIIDVSVCASFPVK
jgi:hypothetical protein